MVAGVVHDPMANETYDTERGGGATINGEPIEASAPRSRHERFWGRALLTVPRSWRWVSTFSGGWRGNAGHEKIRVRGVGPVLRRDREA